MSLALALDLGGTKVEAALVDASGAIVPGSRHRAATTGARIDRSAGEAAVAQVVRACAEHPRWAETTAAGIGSAGPIDLGAGTISPINLPALHGYGIVDAVRRETGLDRVALRLDGTCIALAELWLGAARGVRDAIVIVVSTGVGGGVVSDGRIVSGRSGNAGHLGQLVVDRVEADAAAATVEGIAAGPHTVAWAVARGWSGATGEELAASCAAGDAIAREAVARSARAVGLGLVDAATLLDLELAVVGGGFAAVTADYVDQVQASVSAHAVNAYAARMRVTRAALGADAPLVGAAALVHRTDLIG